VLYEAGALAMSSQVGCVVPLLVDVGPEELPAPLAQFQSVHGDKEGTWRVVRSIHGAQGSGMTEEALREAFERAWPGLASQWGLSIRTERRGEVLLVTPSASHFWDEDAVKVLREKMKALLRGGEKRIVVDLAEAGRLTSALSFLFPGLAAGQRKEADVVF